MTRPYRHLRLEKVDDIDCVHLSERRLNETEVQEFTEDLISLIVDDGCRKLVLSLGPGAPQCLYSVFLARLFTVRRRMQEVHGRFIISDANDDVREVFKAVHLEEFFEFAPDVATAIAALKK
jgi:hypothetical protein